ncbi:hypothetical protein [Nocardia africana]
MSLADDVQAKQQETRKPTPCKTGVWFAGLDERDLAAAKSFLADGGAVSDLCRMAGRNGCEAAETQFRKHIKRTCSCYKGMEMAA